MHSQHYYLVIDQGTHGSRCILIDQQGNIQDAVHRPVSLQRINSDRVEQNPSDILDSVRQCLAELMQRSAVEKIHSCALVCQRSSILAWRKDNLEPITPVLSWMDRRAVSQLKALKHQHTRIQSISGLPCSAHYSASKLQWLLLNDPQVQSELDRHNLQLGTLSSYLTAQLIKGQPFIIDASNAQRTQLFDIKALDWSTLLCDLYEIPITLLPRPVPVIAEHGYLDGHSSYAGIPVSIIIGDQNAALYGNAALKQEVAMVNIGTGAFIMKPVEPQILSCEKRLLHSVAVTTNQHAEYMLEATVNGAGSALSWYQQQVVDIDLIQSLPAWLSKIQNPPIFLNQIGGLGSPWWNSEQNSRFVGNNLNRPEHCAVAIIESIVFMLHYNLQLMKDISSIKKTTISGGLSRLDGLCQKLANLTQLETIRMLSTESTARGAACLCAGQPSEWSQVSSQAFSPQVDDGLLYRYSQFVQLINVR